MNSSHMIAAAVMFLWVAVMFCLFALKLFLLRRKQKKNLQELEKHSMPPSKIPKINTRRIAIKSLIWTGVQIGGFILGMLIAGSFSYFIQERTESAAYILRDILNILPLVICLTWIVGIAGIIVFDYIENTWACKVAKTLSAENNAAQCSERPVSPPNAKPGD